MRKYLFKSNLIEKFLCFIWGHRPGRLNYNNIHSISLNRKGGKRKNKVIMKHCREFCTRCGFIIKKR